MSNYILLPLHFIAPVHFGDASSGGGLDAVQSIGRADTFLVLCVVKLLGRANKIYRGW